MSAARTGKDSDFVGLKRPFPIVIAYNDFTAGARAMRAYRLLLEHLGTDFEFRINLWKLGILNDSELCQIAVGDAAAASMVIICLHEQPELSAPARQWIDSWTQQKQGHAALLALLDSSKSTPGPAEIYLKNAAAAANMDFLLQRIQPMPATESLTKSEPPWSSAPASGI